MKKTAINQDTLTDSIAYCCLQAYLTIKPDVTRLFDELGLRPVEYTVLQIIQANPGISQKQLGQTIKVSPPNLATLLDRMEAADMLVRQRNPRDKRSHVLTLMPYGARLIRKTEGRVAGAEQHLDLNESERTELLRLLKKIFMS